MGRLDNFEIFLGQGMDESSCTSNAQHWFHLLRGVGRPRRELKSIMNDAQ